MLDPGRSRLVRSHSEEGNRRSASMFEDGGRGEEGGEGRGKGRGGGVTVRVTVF